MADAKPLASLSSGLLARKGQATPAMRRQGFDAMIGSSPAALDDLGWNDMGEGAQPQPSPAREQFEHLREQVETPERPANPARMLSPEPRRAPPEPRPAPFSEEATVTQSAEPVGPAATPPPAPVRSVPPIAVRRAREVARPRIGRTATGKAAFTLRLDADRHLKLRLAAALERQSAQVLVTRALDRFFLDLDGLDLALGQTTSRKD